MSPFMIDKTLSKFCYTSWTAFQKRRTRSVNDTNNSYVNISENGNTSN